MPPPKPTKEMTRQPERQAFTLAELLVVLTVLAIAGGLFIPALAGTDIRAQRMQCSANLRQVALAFQIWANDNGGLAPQQYAGSPLYPLLDGGSLVVGWPVPSAYGPAGSEPCPYTFLVYESMSNELNTPKVVVCPADDRPARTNFGNDFGSTYISTGGHNQSVSYFAGRDAWSDKPNMLLAGDRDICGDTTVPTVPNNGYGVSPDGPSANGNICGFPTNLSSLTLTNHVGWSPVRMHQGAGNVALADGSVRQFNTASLVNALAHSGDTGLSSRAPNVLLFP